MNQNKTKSKLIKINVLKIRDENDISKLLKLSFFLRILPKK